MDVTPRELRDVEIREAFRGYNRDEVNDLLERAAAAIEVLNERTRVLSERVASGPAEGETGRETEAMLHRTLLLAQRASDEAIAEAEEKARAMIEDAETRSRRMLADAVIEARRTTESERRRLEQEIEDLETRRELLSTDVAGLEHFETDYRSRLMGAMEADLHAIERDLQAIRDRAAAQPENRPTISDLGGRSTDSTEGTGSGAGDTEARSSQSGAGDPSETVEVDTRGGAGDDKRKPLVGSGSGVPASEPISEAAQAAASEMVVADREGHDAPAAKVAEAPATIDLFGAEQAAVESAALDDDSFFASLRDAVRDDAPLGPRDATERAFFDQDSKDSPSFREAFKRRR
jgi:cell division initiation protein